MPDKTPQTVLDIVAFFTSKPIISILSFLAGIAIAIIPQWNKWCIKRQEIALTNKINNRKEKIRHWREELNKIKSLGALYSNPVYNELRGFIPKDEMSSLLKDDSVHVIIGIGPTTQDSRIIMRYHQAISEKEKKWGII